MDKVRLDRFLWATRQFRTRSLSTDACKRNWISINDITAKPSRNVQIGNIIKIKHPSYLKSFKVMQILDKRIGASKLKDFIEDLTPESEYIKDREFRKNRTLTANSSSLKGRPSKKQRRDLEEFLNPKMD
jgi:ribosome-associated heat shock protein Hsp15